MGSGSLPSPLMSTHIYHERQLGALCGVHCVNNLLQGPRFGPGDLAEIAVRLDKKERRLLGKTCRAGGTSGEESSSCNFDSSADGGNFSIQVLSIALARAGLKLLPAEHPDARELMEGDLARKVGAFVVQRRGHWYGLRSIGPCWWDLDSLLRRPKPLDDKAVADRLDRLAKGGYSTFLVTGDLPFPLPPLAGRAISSTCPPEASLSVERGGTSWHEAATLLAASPSSSITSANHTGSRDGRETSERVAESLEGFAEAEVQAALFLADQDQQRAAEMLHKAHRSIESLDAASPQLLARALSAAVGAVLQARRSMPAAIARLVALLCAPDSATLASAAELVDCGELAHDLLTALAKKARGWLWTDGIMQAATVAVDLLLALPVASVGNASCRSTGETFEAPASGSDGEVAPLQLPSMGATLSTPSSRGVRNRSHDVDESFEKAHNSADVDFSTTALDDLLESVACEGPPPGQPLTSAIGLKAILSAPSKSGGENSSNPSHSPATEHRSRVRRRPSARRLSSQRIPA
mmetsp:Transcript_51232/g.81392  ORF Transcript_51232/g.81392 Transcript_51232/m.81392 type:complete len:525 (+) Transcript_51232:36-1610(+)